MASQGKERHCLSDIDETARIGCCSVCGLVRLKLGGHLRNGKKSWRCYIAWSRRQRDWVYKKRMPKHPVCERCDFVGLPCQFDTHHRNGDHSDNRWENLEVLCANCHRLEGRV